MNRHIDLIEFNILFDFDSLIKFYDFYKEN